jgi:SAM-dependent methyltransferase
MRKDWNAAYENEETPWDKGFAAPPLREFMATHRIAGRVVVPGCGSGHDVRLLAERGAQVLGLDIAAGAVRKAERFARVGSECFAVADFLDLPARYHGRFEYVVEHTCLCALEPAQRGEYARSVCQALRPGGHFLSVFYRQVKDYDGDGPPHPISAEQIEALFGANFETVESLIPQESYPSRPVGCEEVRLMRKRS